MRGRSTAENPFFRAQMTYKTFIIFRFFYTILFKFFHNYALIFNVFQVFLFNLVSTVLSITSVYYPNKPFNFNFNTMNYLTSNEEYTFCKPRRQVFSLPYGYSNHIFKNYPPQLYLKQDFLGPPTEVPKKILSLHRAMQAFSSKQFAAFT